MRSPPRSLLLPALLLLTIGCERRAAEPAEAAPPAAEVQAAPGERTVPIDSLFGATAVENLRLIPMEVEVPNLPRGWEGARLAAFSDFQLGLWEDNEQVAAAAVQRAVEAGAEVFLLLGGYLAREDQAEALGRVLAPLRGRSALAVLSSYDARSEEMLAQVTSTLDAQGITILRNERAALERGGDTLRIAGLAPNYLYLPDWRQVMTVDTLGTRTTPILLTPFPELARLIPVNRYSLVLAGRVFCGDVEIPGTPRLAALAGETLQGFQVEGVERLYRVRGNPLFITCGTGYTFVPVRLSAPAEALLITLRGPPQPVQPDTTAAPPSDTLRQ